MDKLDRLSPKDIKPLKDSPIAQGLISNTIFAVAWNGVSAVIGLLIRHYALIFGIPPSVALSAGVIAFFLFALSYNLIMRRRDAKALSVATAETLESVSPTLTKPTIEILSPFDNDEVGLYERVRGRVFPPEQELQVVVFAGDKKWYPQGPVSVKGSTWSVKCQFGNLNTPSSGEYKVVALLGDELQGGTYRELPTGIPKSNIVTVHRREVTMEHKLSGALNERDHYKAQLQTATSAFTDMEERVETLTAEKTKLERALLAETSVRESKEAALEIKRQELTAARAETEDQRKLNREIWDAKVMSEAEAKEAVEQLSKELAQSKSEAENEKKRVNYETSQREEFIKLYHGADHQLAIWKPITEHAKAQAAQIDEWVRMKEAIPAKLLLKRRLVTLKIRLYNESLYPVRIVPKAITGQLRFKGIPLREEIQTPADEPTIEVEPRGTGIIKLLQPLRVFEADNIRESREGGDNDALFWLGDVYIPISAKDTATPVITKPLIIIPDHISLDVHLFSYNEKTLDTSDIS